MVEVFSRVFSFEYCKYMHRVLELFRYILDTGLNIYLHHRKQNRILENDFLIDLID